MCTKTTISIQVPFSMIVTDRCTLTHYKISGMIKSRLEDDDDYDSYFCNWERHYIYAPLVSIFSFSITKYNLSGNCKQENITVRMNPLFDR